MAKRGPDEAFVLVDGYDIGQRAHELSVTIESEVENQTHGFGVEWEESEATGVSRGMVDYSGVYDDADNLTAEALDEHAGLEEALVVAFGGNSQGSKAFGCLVNQSSHTRSAGRGAIQKTAAHYEASGAVEEGVVLSSLTAEDSDGATDDGSHDFGAAGTKLSAYLEVTELALGGYTSVTVAIQESSDNGAGDAWADVVTFTAVTAESFAERKAIGVSTERYLRAELTWAGSGSSESVTMMVVVTE